QETPAIEQPTSGQSSRALVLALSARDTSRYIRHLSWIAGNAGDPLRSSSACRRRHRSPHSPANTICTLGFHGGDWGASPWAHPNRSASPPPPTLSAAPRVSCAQVPARIPFPDLDLVRV